jgi:hypothetical protein
MHAELVRHAPYRPDAEFIFPAYLIIASKQFVDLTHSFMIRDN